MSEAARRKLRGAAKVLAVGVPTWLGLSWVAAWLVVHPITRRIPPEPPLAGVRWVDAAFSSSDGAPLSGWWFPVEAAVGTIVLCHGAFENRMAMMDCVQRLGGAGFHTLAFDLRARGRSGGACSTLGKLETDDALAAVEWAVRRPEAEGSLLGLMGFSQGGAVALMAAAREPRVAAVLADSAFASLDRAEGRHLRTFLGPLALPVGAPCRAFGRRMVGFDLATVRPVDEVPRIAPRPILLIHGTRDFMIDLEDARLLRKAAGDNATLWTVEGARHTKSRRRMPEEYWRRVTGFWLAALRAPDRPATVPQGGGRDDR